MLSKSRHTGDIEPLLGRLAALYGVDMEYRDSRGVRRRSPVESVCVALEALGAEIDASSTNLTKIQLQAAMASRQASLDRRVLEPVLVAWDGVLAPTILSTRFVARTGRMRCVLQLEGADTQRYQADVDTLDAMATAFGHLPFGYHRLFVQTDGHVAEAAVISAPRRCWDPGPTAARRWGVFSPLYSLRSDRDWGAGDIGDLEVLQEAVAEAGGSAVATLPLLAVSLDRDSDPAPYRPVSRLFWNELYLAVDRTAEWESCAEARELWDSVEMQAEVAALKKEPLVDYQGVMACKKRVLARLSRCFAQTADPSRMADFSEFLRLKPEVEEYALSRARVETAPSKALETRDYHLYCQWQMEEQLGGLSSRVSPGLFLDLPVGVHPDGYDTWRWPHLFAAGVSIGAPPDAFFAGGQDWNCPPLHPENCRAQGHQYLAQCLRHQMRHARYLRVDHVMGLHRLFWIPEGAEAAEGVYVSYPAEEQYAVLCLESHRNQTVVVGEDLGTVPSGVRSSMRRHGVLRTWVLQAALQPRAAQPLAEAPAHAVAGLGTHDMFPFVGFLRGDDIAARMETGQIDQKNARREMAARAGLVTRLAAVLSDPQRVGDDRRDTEEVRLLRGAVSFLLAGSAALVIVGLDDLLLETKPQNIPGTGPEMGNWRRKHAGSMEIVRRAIAEFLGEASGASSS
ncbi:MAG: 4-alpha-glucanotransferase [Thermoleophilia bacterium]|nr:4-alpha-glucanotransferase [Thermoleophilia bacterium]